MIDNTKKISDKEEDKIEADISLEFLEEYKKLVEKYKRDFAQGEVHIVKIEKIK